MHNLALRERLTGGAPLVPLAVLFGLNVVLASVARVSNEPIDHLLHPPVGNPAAAAAGALLGWIGATYGWQTTFVLISLPTFAMAIAGLRLKEPLRGGTMGVTTAQPAVAFREACRQLFAVRTLRGMWVGALLLGMLIVPLRQLHSLLFEQRLHYGPVGRGTILALGDLGLVIGIVALNAWAIGLLGMGGVLSLAITTYTAPYGAATSLLALASFAGTSGMVILLSTRFVNGDNVVPNLRQEEIRLR